MKNGRAGQSETHCLTIYFNSSHIYQDKGQLKGLFFFYYNIHKKCKKLLLTITGYYFNININKTRTNTDEVQSNAGSNHTATRRDNTGAVI